MNFIPKRVVALAATTTIIACTFGAIAAGASAQDQAGAETHEAVTQFPTDAHEPRVRFVANPVVQTLPAGEAVDEAADQTEADAVVAASLPELVADIPTADTLSRDMRCLAQAVYFEARGEPLSGQLAVARVVVNRSSSDAFPDDYCSVVTQRAQFSFVRGGRIPEPNRSTKAWRKAKAIAKIAHRDMWQSPVGDALYFHATHIRPRWASRMQARATIDRHIFYR